MSGGWFPVARDDLAVIRDCAGERDAGTLVGVWLAMLDIGNATRASVFAVTIGRVSRTAGFSYRATAGALKRLAAVGLLGITPRRLEGTSGFDASEYALKATVSPSADSAEPSADSAQPSASPVSPEVPKEITIQTKKRETLTRDNFRDQALRANNGRLSASEVERFTEYWLEAGRTGKVRFEVERFFDVSRRLATWSSRVQTSARPTAPATGLTRRAD